MLEAPVDVDRSRFLLLTAAISAATAVSCATKVSSEIPPGARGTPSPRDDASVDVGASDLGRAYRDEVAPGDDPSDGDPARADGYRVDAEGYAVDEDGNPVGHGPADEQGLFDPYGPTDERGRFSFGPAEELGGPVTEYRPPPRKVDQRCRRLKAPGPTCESFEDTRASCSNLVRVLEPRVAERAVACLQRRSGTAAICSWDSASTCAESALGGISGDARSTRDCRAALHKCDASQHLDAATCQAAVTRVAPEHRDRLAACIAEFCEVGTCLMYLE